MASHPELTRRFQRMPLEVAVPFASTSRHFVMLVTQRRTTGRFVPHRYTPQVLAELAVQADLAGQVAAGRLAALADLVDASDLQREGKPRAS